MHPSSLTRHIFFAAFFACIFTLQSNTSRSFADQVVINAVGDIMLAGKGTGTYARKGYDYPFAAVSHELKNADITIGNLEAPITLHGTEFTGKKFRFRINPVAAGALQRAGFTVLTLANNHIMDYGPVGLKDTMQHLDKAGILYSGAGDNLDSARKPAIVLVGNEKIAFLSYSLTFPTEFYARKKRAGTAPGVSLYIKNDIASAKSKYDYVIVSFHWGTENAPVPSPYQRTAAHGAIDAGADIVIGHHPHVLQGIERYGKGIIFYSLGNFAFGCMNRGPGLSAIARVTLDSGIMETEIFPLDVKSGKIFFQPKFLGGKRGLQVIRHLNTLSKPFGTRICQDGNHYILCEKNNGNKLTSIER